MAVRSIRLVLRTTGQVVGDAPSRRAITTTAAAAAAQDRRSFVPSRPAALAAPAAPATPAPATPAGSPAAGTQSRLCSSPSPAWTTFSSRPAARAYPPSRHLSCQGASIRLLSTTAPRHARHAISFLPASSTELDQTLEEIRLKILVPSYLNSAQQHKLFSPRYRDELLATPITMEIDGETLHLGPVDRMTEQPNGRRLVREAVGRMETRDDFANLPRLLEGLHAAKRTLLPDDYARFTRLAGERGCIYTIIECARTVARTGFRLDQSETVTEILNYVQLRAVDAGWAPSTTRQSLSWAEMVVDMLEDAEHARSVPAQPRASRGSSGSSSTTGATSATTAPPTRPSLPLARDPQPLSARLHLAAMVADQYATGAAAEESSSSNSSEAGEEEAKARRGPSESNKAAAAQEKVERYAAELVRLWPPQTKLRAIHAPEVYARRAEMYYLTIHNKFLSVAAPLLHGLEVAEQVLRRNGKETLADEIHQRGVILRGEIQEALAASPPDRRGASIYKKFYGEQEA